MEHLIDQLGIKDGSWLGVDWDKLGGNFPPEIWDAVVERYGKTQKTLDYLSTRETGKKLIEESRT